jgi:DNA topoisomerase III
MIKHIHQVKNISNSLLVHPTKMETNLNGKEKDVYELICRHFLACCSQDGIGYETIITVDISSEIFTTSGLMIKALNYLNIYKYEKWTDKSLPVFEENEIFQPTALLMKEEKTRAPPLLTEDNLISLMDKNQIGTDATIAQHIKNITVRINFLFSSKDREYTFKQENVYLPTKLGLALIQGYDAMDIPLSKPNLRAKSFFFFFSSLPVELDMKKISQGKDQSLILYENIEMYRSVYKDLLKKYQVLYESMENHFDTLGVSKGTILENSFSTCGKCQKKMMLKNTSENIRFLFCSTCKDSFMVPKCKGGMLLILISGSIGRI